MGHYDNEYNAEQKKLTNHLKDELVKKLKDDIKDYSKDDVDILFYILNHFDNVKSTFQLIKDVSVIIKH